MNWKWPAAWDVTSRGADVTNRIAKDLFKLMKPKYLQIYGDFNPRGGIAIKPFVELWGKVSELLSDEPTQLQRDALSIDPVAEA